MDLTIADKKRYCFDLDNTLVTFPDIYGDYSTVQPIQRNINFVNLFETNGQLYYYLYCQKNENT